MAVGVTLHWMVLNSIEPLKKGRRQRHDGMRALLNVCAKGPPDVGLSGPTGKACFLLPPHDNVNVSFRFCDRNLSCVACVRAQIVLLLRRRRPFHFFRSLSHALILLPPLPSYTDRRGYFTRLRGNPKTPSTIPEGIPVIPSKNKQRGAEAVIRATRPSPEIAR